MTSGVLGSGIPKYGPSNVKQSVNYVADATEKITSSSAMAERLRET